MSQSLIYTNIHLYRLAMNLLYGGAYLARFDAVVRQFGDGSSVCELCFGDTIIAEWCRAHGVRWTGIDLNPGFCRRAGRKGFEVMEGSVFSVAPPDADLFVMAGSLYHFHDRLEELLSVVWRHTRRFVVSEPVRNLSTRGGPVGWWARRSANPGDGVAPFRYELPSLLSALERAQASMDFTVELVSSDRDALLMLQRGT